MRSGWSKQKGAKDVAVIVADQGELTMSGLADILGCSKTTARSYLLLAVELSLLEVDMSLCPFRFYPSEEQLIEVMKGGDVK